MPACHGRRISSVGLRMFSRSCSARIVGDAEVTQLSIVPISTGSLPRNSCLVLYRKRE